MRVNNAEIFDGYVITTQTSDAYRLQHFNGFSIMLTVANGAGFGATAKLQASDDEGPDGFGGGVAVTHWVDLPNTGSTANISLSSNGSSLWNVDGAFYKWVRVSVGSVTGWADVTIRANGKGPDAQ